MLGIAVGMGSIFRSYYIEFLGYTSEKSRVNDLIIVSFCWNVFLCGIPSMLYVVYGTVFKVHLNELNLKFRLYFALFINDKDQIQKLKDEGYDLITGDFFSLVLNMERTRRRYKEFVQLISLHLFAENLFKTFAWICIFFFSFINVKEKSVIFTSLLTDALLLLVLYQQSFLADLIQIKVSNVKLFLRVVFKFVLLNRKGAWEARVIFEG